MRTRELREGRILWLQGGKCRRRRAASQFVRRIHPSATFHTFPHTTTHFPTHSRPCKDPGNGAQRLDTSVLLPLCWSAADVETSQLRNRCRFVEVGHKVGVLEHNGPVAGEGGGGRVHGLGIVDGRGRTKAVEVGQKIGVLEHNGPVIQKEGHGRGGGQSLRGGEYKGEGFQVEWLRGVKACRSRARSWGAGTQWPCWRGRGADGRAEVRV